MILIIHNSSFSHVQNSFTVSFSFIHQQLLHIKIYLGILIRFDKKSIIPEQILNLKQTTCYCKKTVFIIVFLKKLLIDWPWISFLILKVQSLESYPWELLKWVTNNKNLLQVHEQVFRRILKQRVAYTANLMDSLLYFIS